VRQDDDGLFDVYDARAGGGIVAQNEPPPPVCTAREPCVGPPLPPPPFEGPGTNGFSGSNSKETRSRCPKGRHIGKSKGKARCVPNKQRKHKGKKSRRRAAAGTGRAGL
jgi:hypothetical protein